MKQKTKLNKFDKNEKIDNPKVNSKADKSKKKQEKEYKKNQIGTRKTPKKENSDAIERQEYLLIVRSNEIKSKKGKGKAKEETLHFETTPIYQLYNMPRASSLTEANELVKKWITHTYDKVEWEKTLMWGQKGTSGINSRQKTKDKMKQKDQGKNTKKDLAEDGIVNMGLVIGERWKGTYLKRPIKIEIRSDYDPDKLLHVNFDVEIVDHIKGLKPMKYFLPFTQPLLKPEDESNFITNYFVTSTVKNINKKEKMPIDVAKKVLIYRDIIIKNHETCLPEIKKWCSIVDKDTRVMIYNHAEAALEEQEKEEKPKEENTIVNSIILHGLISESQSRQTPSEEKLKTNSSSIPGKK